jgi:hypothetical protein
MRLNGMNIARLRNPAAPPPGDLTVRLKDGREVNTTPEFVDANGGLFSYDDYIKGALINRFPKDDSIPFYAFSLNAKANALYEKLGAWAKKGGDDAESVWDRYCHTHLIIKEYRLATLSRSSLQRCIAYARCFPTAQEFSACPDANVSEFAWKKVTDYWRGQMAPRAVMTDWLWDGTHHTGSPFEHAALIAAFIKIARVDPVAELAARNEFLPVMAGNVLVAVVREWDKNMADPAFKSEAELISARLREVEAARQARWAAASASAASTSSSSSFSSSSSSSSDMPPAATGSYSTPSQDITGMQYAQAMQINEALFGKRNPRTRLNGLNVARKPVSRQVQERQALRSHLHEQRDEEAAQQADRALRARQQRQAQFVRHTQSVVDGLVKKYSAMGSRGTTFTRWNVIDDLLADPMIEKHIAIYIEDPLTVYITEAGKPAYRQKNRMLTEHLRDQALQHIADSASLMP